MSERTEKRKRRKLRLMQNYSESVNSSDSSVFDKSELIEPTKMKKTIKSEKQNEISEPIKLTDYSQETDLRVDKIKNVKLNTDIKKDEKKEKKQSYKAKNYKTQQKFQVKKYRIKKTMKILSNIKLQLLKISKNIFDTLSMSFSKMFNIFLTTTAKIFTSIGRFFLFIKRVFFYLLEKINRISANRTFLKYFVPFILLFALFFGLIAVFKLKPKQHYNRKIPVVQITKPKIRTLFTSLEFTSYIESNTMSPAVSYLSGKVVDMMVEAGEFISKDDVIAKIDPELYQLQQDAAAAISDVSDGTFERVEELYMKGAVSKQNYEEAKAKRDAYFSQLQQANLQLSYTEIKSPKDGVVLTTLVKGGDSVAQGTPMAIIGDLDDLCVNVNVPEKYLSDVEVGDEARVLHRGTKEYCHGTVELIEPFVNPKSKTFKIKIKIDSNFNHKIFVPGSTVEVQIYQNIFDNVYCISREALNSSDMLYYIVRQSEDQTVDKNLTYSNIEKTRFYFGEARILDSRNFNGDEDFIVIDDRYANYDFVIRGQNTLFNNQKVKVEVANE